MTTLPALIKFVNIIIIIIIIVVIMSAELKKQHTYQKIHARDDFIPADIRDSVKLSNYNCDSLKTVSFNCVNSIITYLRKTFDSIFSKI